MHVRPDEPLLSFPSGLLPGYIDAPLTQVQFRLVDVAAGLGERPLAVHDPRPGFVPELFDHLCGNLRHNVFLQSS